MLGAIQRIVSAAIQEQVAMLDPAHVATLSDMDAPEEEVEWDVPLLVPPVGKRQRVPPLVPQKVPL
ncbi:UNVERIFIED_CONTAM: hypothetical protein Sangu_2763000 [Sesamum angustifolium]|uniref:Uncharacterized protein n=1 Tax=Sesamum angustifolium TaxID=2727405 RepID=A0AAW2IUW4_9LAMI